MNARTMLTGSEVFTIPELRRHESKGDDRPGAIDQSGFKGHPRCDFENERFFDDDALYQHCRSDHERCHICDRRHTGGAATYYQNYDTLEQHFRASHFLCPDTECLEKKFVVFESEIDLKAHQLEAHPAGLSKDARREARRIDLSDFDFRSPMVEEPYGRRDARGRGGGGRRGRGRNPDIDRPIPASTAQPMTRAELAFQRIQALDNARPSSLSSTEAFAARPRNNQPHPTQAARAPPSMTFPTANLNNHHPSSSNQQPSNPSPQEQARRAHTAAVFARANKALGNDPPKVLRFRNLITQYSQSSISALNLIESFLTLFYTSASSSSSPDSDSDPSGATELGKLIHELVDLFDAPAKQKALLTAWNDWKAMNLDYPSLALGQSADPSSGVPGGQRGGMRILKLKSATVNSAQSPLGSGRGTAAATAVASRARVAPWAQAVGGLTGGNPASLNKLRASTNPSSNSSPTPAGAFGSLPPNSVSLSMRSAPAPRAYTKPPASAAHARVQEEEAFPALPEQPAKRFPAFSGPGARGGKTMVWGVPRAVAAAQAAAQQQQQQGQSSGIALDGEDGVGQGGKARKGGKGRETLMRWG